MYCRCLVVIGLSNSNGGAPEAIHFKPGTVVAHRNYGYRGVVVSVDECCKATDAWYESDESQPDREQPWYHVLVHDSGGLSTYVAQSHLTRDQSSEPIDHPRIERYFSTFANGCYQPRKRRMKKKSSANS